MDVWGYYGMEGLCWKEGQCCRLLMERANVIRNRVHPLQFCACAVVLVVHAMKCFGAFSLLGLLRWAVVEARASHGGAPVVQMNHTPDIGLKLRGGSSEWWSGGGSSWSHHVLLGRSVIVLLFFGVSIEMGQDQCHLPIEDDGG